MGQFLKFDLERLGTFTPIAMEVSLQDFLSILGAPRQKIGKIWKLDPFDRNLVKKAKSKFSAVGRPK